jgi:beta-lactamase class D/beta-lactamase class D OXA-1
MKKIIFSLLLLFISNTVTATTIDFSQYFHNKTGCFLLYDLNQHKLVAEYNSNRCAQQISPDSTFKIPLSLMAFDQQKITQHTVFHWDGKARELPQWNQDQTPQTWLKNSVVWVSQQLTPQLGMQQIKNYLQKFNYGNQDFSGDPGMQNGLTHAWLESSLKISANEQLVFLEKFVTHRLPVSQQAIINTQQNMYLETSSQGWRLYGKTGSGYVHDKGQNGWFIGFVQNQKAKQTYLIVVNFLDHEKPTANSVAGGPQARMMTQAILKQLDYFN